MQMEVSEKEHEMEMIRRSNLSLEKKNRLISRQKNKLEKAEKTLLELNRTLEQRVMEEVAKRRAQEEAMIQKSKLESLGRLSAGIAHEINQPLGMINIGIQNLFNKLSSGRVSKEYAAEKAKHFTQNIDRIRRIIDHIRLFSRDQQSAIPEPTDTREVISNALSMLQAQCAEHNIKVITDLTDLPMRVFGNRYRLEQVLLNLLSNSIKFTEKGHIRITCRAEGDFVKISVADTGIGIKKEDLEKLFRPFTQVETGLTRKYEGTGLGLSISKRLVSLMGGTVTVESEWKKGSTFSFTVPVDRKVS